MKLLNPSSWPRPTGYSNGIAVRGTQIFVAGQVGWDETESLVSDRFVDQARQALTNIVTVLAEANAGPEHIVRMTWYVTDKGDYLGSLSGVGAAYREVIGRHFPTMSLVVVAGLVEDGAKLEIEATAVVPD